MNYTIIDKKDIPDTVRGKWLGLFDNLPDEKVLLFELDTMKEAQLRGISISGCMRSGRRPFRIRYRTITNSGKVQLYVWKEAKT